jgi:hypothetical protein
MSKRKRPDVSIVCKLVEDICDKGRSFDTHANRARHVETFRQRVRELLDQPCLSKRAVVLIEAALYKAYAIGLCDELYSVQSLDDFKRSIGG